MLKSGQTFESTAGAAGKTDGVFKKGKTFESLNKEPSYIFPNGRIATPSQVLEEALAPIKNPNSAQAKQAVLNYAAEQPKHGGGGSYNGIGTYVTRRDFNRREEAEKYALDQTKGDGFEQYSLDQLKTMVEKAKKNYDFSKSPDFYKGTGENFVQDFINTLGVNQNVENEKNRIKNDYEAVKKAYDKRLKAKDGYLKYSALPNGTAKTTNPDHKKYGGFGTGGVDWRYEYINNIDNAQFKIEVAEADTRSWSDYKYKFMTDREIGIYNHLYASKGKKEAETYLKYLNDDLEERMHADNVQKKYQFANKNALTGVAASLESIGTNLASGVEQGFNMLKYPITGKMDRNRTAELSSALRQGVMDQVNWKIGKWDAFDFVYSTAMSGADSLVAASIPGPFVGEVALGLSAAANATNDILERGGSNEQAFWGGLTAGVFESLFEHISIGELKSMKEGTVEGFKDLAKNISKSMITNLEEESATEIANILYDTVANGEISQYETLVKEYSKKYDEETAKKKAARDLALQIAEAGASGALMGAGFGAIGSYEGYKNYKKSTEYQRVEANNKILNLIQKVKNNDFKMNDRVKLENVTPEVAKTIKDITGIDVTDYEVFIEARQIKHILKDHGAEGKSDHSMSDDSDIAKIEYVLRTPDSIVDGGSTKAYSSFKNGKHKPSKTVLYEKTVGEKSYYAVEAVPNTSKKALYIVSAFIGKSSNKKEAPQTADAINPGVTPKSESVDASVNSIPQNGNSVKNENGVLQSTAKKAAAEQFNQETGADFSESASFMPENPDLQSTAKKAAGAERGETVFREPPIKEIARLGDLRDLFAKPGETEMKGSRQLHIEETAKKFGLRVKWDETISRGKYNRENHTVYLNPKLPTASLYCEVFKHEFTHYLESKKAYAAFQTYLFRESPAFMQWVDERLVAAGETVEGTRADRIGRLQTIYTSEYKASQEISQFLRNRFTAEDARSEMTADFVGENLFKNRENTNWNALSEETGLDALAEIAQTNRSLFQKIMDWVREKINQFKGSAKNKTLVEDLRYLEDRLARVYDSAENKKAATESGEQWSIAGEKANIADRSLLAQAQQMEKNGFDSETVRQKTGWFKGYDGKWRFEIDDKDISVNFTGKNSQNPDVKRYSQLENRFIIGELTNDEISEFRQLSENLKGVNKTPTRLGDIVSHPTIFKAYPELADIKVVTIEDARSGENGAYNRKKNEIEINSKIKKDHSKLKKTMIHEIQHAIQGIEGFAFGANAENQNYENVAGEIEARDASSRIDLTPEQRKNTRPDVDRADVVFADGGVKYEAKYSVNEEENYHDFNKPITMKDVEVLRKIAEKRGRISINDFTSEDIQKAQKWAYKFYKELGVKSPFFRAWFGDWRAADNTEIVEVSEMGDSRNPQINDDTGWKINASKKVHKETAHQSGSSEKNAVKYLRYIDDITRKAVLFETEISDNDNPNSLMFHTMYAYTEVNGYPALLKLKVEELYSEGHGETDIFKRDYILQSIEEETLSSRNRVSSPNHEENTSSVKSISDLYALVKKYDKNFKPGKSVNEALLNEDGTPKVFYHGTNADFTVFDPKKFNTTETSGDYVGEGFFFAFDRNTAGKYGKNVMSAYLRMENPLIIRTEQDAKAFRESFLGAFANGEQEMRDLLGGDYDYFSIMEENPAAIREELQRRGYDGMIDYLYGQAAVFNPNQIKSATDNIGTFDSENPDIQHSIPITTAEKLVKQFTDGKIDEKKLVKELNKLTDIVEARLEEYRRQEKERKISPQERREWNSGEILSNAEKLARERAEAVEAEREAQAMIKDRQSNLYVIRRTVRKLDTALRTNSKAKHIPEEYKTVVRDFCKVFAENDRTPFDHHDLSAIHEFYLKATNAKAEPGVQKIAYDPYLDQMLSEMIDTLTGRRLSDLNTWELAQIRTAGDALNYQVDHAGEVFLDEKREQYEKIGSQAMQEVQWARPTGIIGARQSKAAEGLKKFFIEGNMTPLYFMKRLGPTFEKIYQDLGTGESKWAKNMRVAKAFLSEVKKEHHYTDWKDTTIHYQTDGGVQLEMTADQALQIYVTARRENQNFIAMRSKHMKLGGIVLDTEALKKTLKENGKKSKSNSLKMIENLQSKAIQITYEDAQNIHKMLTKEQIDYADKIVDFLSTQGAVWGNEVTMKLYGYRQYTEEYYFPIVSSSLFLEQQAERPAENMVARPGFTHSLQKHADSTMIISGLTDVAAGHMESMIGYNAMAVPLETFNRVYNYKTPGIEGTPPKSMLSEIERKYGSSATDYMTNLFTDFNNGVRADKRDSFVQKAITGWKRHSVLANLSVIAQQPFAVLRATNYIDWKYLTEAYAKKYRTKNNVEEMRQFSGVFTIKEMGRFDTGMGVTNKEWLLEENEQAGKEKIKALFAKDSKARDDLFGWGAGKADEVAWSCLWSAVKAEVDHTTDLTFGSEEFYEKCAERFEQVVRATQVYDSTLVKSQNMRNKGLTGMITAFMAEPTVSMNILADAAMDFAEKKTDGKRFTRAVMSVIIADIFTAMAQSLVTAARDDDDEKSYLEKYLKEVVANSLDNLFIPGKIPFIRDIFSNAKGYHVDRPDMEMIGNLIDALKSLGNEKKSLKERIFAVAEAAGIALNVPAKNILRDTEAVIRTIYGFFDQNADKTDLIGAKDAIFEGLMETAGMRYTVQNQYKAIYEAAEKGDFEEYKRRYEKLVESGKKESAVHAGVIAQYKKKSSVIKETAAYQEELEENKAYRSLPNDQKKQVTGEIQKALAIKALSTATNRDTEIYDKIYECIRNGRTDERKKLEKELLKKGRTQQQIKDGIELARYAYMKKVGVDLHEYFLYKKMLSNAEDKKQATKKEVLQEADFDKETERAITKNIRLF